MSTYSKVIAQTERLTDTHTYTQTHTRNENITSTAYTGGNNKGLVLWAMTMTMIETVRPVWHQGAMNKNNVLFHLTEQNYLWFSICIILVILFKTTGTQISVFTIISYVLH